MKRLQQPQAPAVDRAFDILEYLLSKNSAVGMWELSKHLYIPKATVFRVLKTLERRGYVYSPSKGTFILGAELISLGSGVLDQFDLKQVANPYMFELAEYGGHACSRRSTPSP